MYRGTILRLLTMAYILRDNPEGGGGGGADDQLVVVERPAHVDEDEWEGLSDSEREALVETDEGEGAHQILGTDDEFADDEDPNQLTEDDLAGLLEDDGAAPDGDETTVVDDGTATTVDDTTFVVDETITVSDSDLLAYRAVVPDSELPLTDEIPAEIQTKLDALEDRFTDGEIEARDYRTEQFKLSQEITRYQIQQRDLARDTAVWNKELAAFVAARPIYKELDANGKVTPKSAMLWAALCKQTDELNAMPDAMSKSGMQVLIEADKALREAFGMPVSGKKPAPAVVAKPDGGKPPAGARPLAKTLTGVPIADANLVADPLRAVGNLSGSKLEAYLETLTPAKREAMLERL